MLIQLNSEDNSKPKEKDNSAINCQLADHILQSGKNMYFYNKNQIMKMQIRKGEFMTKLTPSAKPEEFIKDIIHPFSLIIKNRQINVHIVKDIGMRKYI